MTIPAEEIRAVEATRNFLADLLLPSRTPRVPRAVRLQARDLLKHYPWLGRVWTAYMRAGFLGRAITKGR